MKRRIKVECYISDEYKQDVFINPFHISSFYGDTIRIGKYAKRETISGTVIIMDSGHSFNAVLSCKELEEILDKTFEE
jgi:hypothetical protein